MPIVAILFVLGISSAASVAEHAGIGGSLHLPVSRYQKSQPLIELDIIEKLQRRETGSISSVLRNNQTFYAIDLEIGSPLQPLSLILDTGSSDVWVFDKDACEDSTECEPGSVFDSSASTSFKQNDTQLVQRYADGTGALGNWAQDTMQLGGIKIENFNFGVANMSNSTEGVAGIGLLVGEAPYVRKEISQPYKNLPQQLKEQGVIQMSAYSLWLNSNSNKAGSVLFGAIDHAKYTGELYRLPLVPSDYSYVSRFAVSLTGLSSFNSKGEETPFSAFDIPAVFDSGSTIGTIPENYLLSFLQAIGATRYSRSIWIVECDKYSNKDGGLGLQIGGIDITVGFDDLFLPAATDRSSGKRYCVPGFFVTEDNDHNKGMAIIGDNILRTLYVVYDLENLEVAVAAAATGKKAVSSSSIEVLSTGIPGSLVQFNASRPASTIRGYHYDTISVTMFHPTDTIIRPSYSHGPSRSGVAYVPSSVQETIVIGAKKSKNSAATVGASSLLAAVAATFLNLL